MNLVDIATLEFERYILVLIRVSGLFVFAPFFSSQVFPYEVKAACSLVLAWVIYMSVPYSSGELLGEVGMFPYMVVMELMITFVVFFAANLVFNGIMMAGSLMGVHIGFSLTSTIDPFTDAENNVLAQMYYLFGILMFLVFGGTHIMMRALVYSFELIPLGGINYSVNVLDQIIKISHQMWVISLELSGPVLLVMIFVTAGLGLLAKAVPQMNIFAVGFLAKIVLGMIVLLLTIEVSIDYFEELFAQLQGDLIQLVREISPRT